jgi:hypothetical protein
MIQKMLELEPRKNVICKTDAAIYVSLVPLGPSGGRRPLAGDSERPWERPLKTLTASDLFGRRPREEVAGRPSPPQRDNKISAEACGATPQVHAKHLMTAPNMPRGIRRLYGRVAPALLLQCGQTCPCSVLLAFARGSKP